MAFAEPLTIALSKGRIFQETLPLLAHAGIAALEDPETSRKLILATNQANIKLIIVRASDVPTYVQYGAADLGVAGKDVLLEHGGEGLYEPLDLGIARCRLMVAGIPPRVNLDDAGAAGAPLYPGAADIADAAGSHVIPGAEGISGHSSAAGAGKGAVLNPDQAPAALPPSPRAGEGRGEGDQDRGSARPRIATKYVKCAERHFAAKGQQVEVIKLYGSMELAPLVGLADGIVDLVESGNTLKANGLVPLEHIADISSRLVVNKAAWKMKHASVMALLTALRAAVREHQAAQDQSQAIRE